jgi:hypothetical protein
LVGNENGNDTLGCMAWMTVYGKHQLLLVNLMASKDSKFYNQDKTPLFGHYLAVFASIQLGQID